LLLLISHVSCIVKDAKNESPREFRAAKSGAPNCHKNSATSDMLEWEILEIRPKLAVVSGQL
jgi:hypothetical protein